MSCNIPEHDELEDELEKVYQDVVRLEDELQLAKATGGDSGDIGATAAELEQLLDENANLTKERDRYREDYLTQDGRITDLQGQLDDRDDRIKELERAKLRAEDELENARKTLQSEREKASQATKKVGDVDKIRRDEQRDQIKSLQMMQELQEKVKDLTAQLGERDALIQELMQGNQQLVEINDTLAVQVEDLNTDLNEKAQLLSELQRELAESHDQLAVAREAEEDYERRLDQEQGKARRTQHALENELNAARATAAQLKADMLRAKDATGLGQKEQELEQLRAQAGQLKAEVEVRDQALQQADNDLEQLTFKLETLEKRAGTVPAEVKAALDKKLEALQKKEKDLEERVKEEKQRYAELEKSKAKVEADLTDAENWKASYEAGHGLADAVRYQKTLKKDLQRLEGELEKRSAQLSDALEAKEALLLTCQRLKQEAGKPPDFQYPDLKALHKDRQDENSSLRSLVSEMQAQLDELNEERAKHLKKLREAAASAMDKGIKAQGLTAEQLEKVNQYAEALRTGDGKLPLEDRSKALQAEVKRLQTQLEERDRRLEKLERQAVEQKGQQAMLAEARGESAEGAQMRQHLAALARKNSDLRQMMQSLMDQQAGQAGGESMSESDAPPLRGEAGGDQSFPPEDTPPLRREAGGDESMPGDHPVVQGQQEEGDGSVVSAFAPMQPVGPSAEVATATAPKGKTGSPGKGMFGGLFHRKAGKSPSPKAGAPPKPGDSPKAGDPLKAGSSPKEGAPAKAGEPPKAGAPPKAGDPPKAGEVPKGKAAEAPKSKTADPPKGKATDPPQHKVHAPDIGRGAGTTAAAGGSGAGAAAAIRKSEQELLAREMRKLIGDERIERLTKDKEALQRQVHELAKSRAQDHGGGAAADGRKDNAEMQRVLAEVSRLQQMIKELTAAPPRPSGRGTFGFGQSPVSRSVAFAAGGGSPVADGQAAPPRTPQTPHGQELLKRQLRKLNLPPVEWAGEVRDLNAQLVEALEQLGQREQELDGHEELLQSYEEHLASMRSQVSVLYQEHVQYVKEAEDRQKQMAAEAAKLLQERDSLAIKNRHLEAVVSVEEQLEQAPAGPQRAVRQLARKVMVYEVNEAVLARRYSSLQEQLRIQQEHRRRLEGDLIEMEGVSKGRILYLEQWKAQASSRLLRLEGQLRSSAPLRDHEALRGELEHLRAEHLTLMEREAEARVRIIEQGDLRRKAQQLEDRTGTLQKELVMAQKERAQADRRVKQAEDLMATAVREAAAQMSALEHGRLTGDFSRLVKEISKHQKAAAQAEVESSGLQMQLQLSESRLQALQEEWVQLRDRAAIMDMRERQAHKESEAARRELLEVKARYNGGATAHDALAMQDKMSRLEKEQEGLRLEAERYKELADIAVEQAGAIGAQRKDNEEELADLRKHVAELESRSDDDIIIGRSQRRLIATKMTYRSFARKHEMTRANLRQKAAALRVLESRLDKREDALLDLQAESRDSIAALKRALQEVADRGLAASDDPQVRELNLARARDMAAKVSRLATALEDKDKAVQEAETAKHRAETECEMAEEGKKSLERLLQDLTVVTQKGEKSHEASRRVLALSEELRATKLASLEGRRQLQALREEKRRVEQQLAQSEQAIKALEEAKVDAETKELLGGNANLEGGELVASVSMSDSGVGAELRLLSPRRGPGGDAAVPAQDPKRRKRAPPASQSPRSPGGGGMPAAPVFGGLDPEEALQRLQDANRRNIELMKQLADAKAEREQALNRAEKAEHAVGDRERQLQYYHQQARQNGLPGLGSPGRAESPSPPRHMPEDVNRRLMQAEEQMQLQRAATATISSLKQLIEEKNRTIDKYKQKLEEVREVSRATGLVERHEISRLTDKIYQDNVDSLNKLRQAVRQLNQSPALAGGDALTLSNRLILQLEEVSSLLGEKDHGIRELELRLRTALHHKDKAEERCGEALEEMEHMRRDMMVLAGQLQDAEERAMAAMEQQQYAGGPRQPSDRPRESSGHSGGTSRSPLEALQEAEAGRAMDPQGRELRKALLAKEGKLRALRSALVRLKQEFVLAEEAREEAAIKKEHEKSRQQGDKATAVGDKVSGLQHQLEALRHGLARAKEDIDKGRKAREKVQQARDQAQEENTRLKEEVARAESESKQLEEKLTRCKREMDRMREREVRLKAKAGGGGEGKDGDADGEDSTISKGAARRIADLMRRIQVLTAQNAALRGGAPPRPPPAEEKKDPLGGGRRLGSREDDLSAQQKTGPDVAGVLGELAMPSSSAALPDHRRAWDRENKLKKRVDVLEKRLEERTQELQAAESQCAQARELLARAQRDKEALQKRAESAGARPEKPAPAAAVDVAALEEARERVLELEDQNDRLRRKVEVDHPREVEALRHQVRTLRGQLEETDAELETAHKRLNAITARARSGQGSGTLTALRAEEDLFHEKEALRDELMAAKAANREMEGQVLERDASAMELRFELEAKAAETDRLRRRVGELQAALHASDGGATGTGKDRAPGGRFKRERDLEGVVEALKRVVEKLKAENDRLRRGAAEGARTAEADRKAKEAAKRAGEMQEELAALRAKAQVGEEAVQRLAQKQEAINQLRRNLKLREQELAQARGEAANAERQKALLVEELEAANAGLTGRGDRAAIRPGGAQAEVAALKSQVEEQRALIRDLKAQSGLGGGGAGVAALQAELADLRAQMGERGRGQAWPARRGDPGGPAEWEVIAAENGRLKAENDKLARELQAFDLDFFEEIEDLKYKYSQAVRKLRQYEGGTSVEAGRALGTRE